MKGSCISLAAEQQRPTTSFKTRRKSCACVQMSVADREQEIMSAAGLSTVGGTGTVGHGAMERALRIVPGEEALLPPYCL